VPLALELPVAACSIPVHGTLVQLYCVVLVLVLGACAAQPAKPPSTAPDTVVVYFGTYTSHGGASRGIYRAALDLRTGILSGLELAAEARDPSFLVVHPDGRHLYAVEELEELDGKPTGGVIAYEIDPVTHGLRRLNELPTRGRAPCHLALDAGGRHLFVANYVDGNVTSFALAADGSLDRETGTVQHQGSGPDRARQEGPHAHATVFDPAGQRLYVVDLGVDRVFAYRVDGATGALVASDPPSTSLTPGTGPRHLALHPSGRFAYVNGELQATVVAFAHDAATGALRELQTLSTLPADSTLPKSTAEIELTADGKFLYVSNRGHDSLAVFRVDQTTGLLTPAGHVLTQGKAPRHFKIDPTGTFLVAANQDSDSVVVFRIDHATGALTAVAPPVAVPRPVCVAFLPSSSH
jgi:6-phosphogluconolactonase